MIIHIVRHAEAIERSSEISEEHRYLTPRGRRRFRKIAATARKSGIRPDVILTSPMVRAVQTADILAEKLRYDGDLQLAAALGQGLKPKSLDKFLDSWLEAGEVALVGHEPDVGELAQVLLASDATCAMKKGAIISFERMPGDQGEARFIQLVWGKGKVITSRSKALKLLQTETEGH